MISFDIPRVLLSSAIVEFIVRGGRKLSPKLMSLRGRLVDADDAG